MIEPVDLRVVICARKTGFARTLRMALSGMGVRGMQLSSDPIGAVRAIQGQGAHAIIVHVDEPEFDIGISLTRFLRRWERSPNRQIPIIAASDRSDIATITSVINSGANEFCLFPTSGETLWKRISAAMTSERPFVESAGYVGPCRRRRAKPDYAGPERRLNAAPAPEVAIAS
jgi:DNA-binding NarL/FixJ family response regulator